MLRKLDDDELLELARSVSGAQVDSSTSRSVLARIVGESFSLGEIRDKVKLKRKRVEPGKLIKDALRLGGRGQLLLSISVVITLGSYYALLYYPFMYPFDQFQTLSLVGIASSAISILFVVSFWVSVRRVTRVLGGSLAGSLGGLSGFVAFAAALSYHILELKEAIMPVYFPTSYITRGSFPGQFLPIVHSVFLSLMFLFIGAFFVAHRKHFPNGELWFLAGMFYVFAGIAETSFPSIYVPSWTAIAAGSLGALCLLTSRSEERYEVVEFARDDLRVGAVGQVFLLASAAIMIVGYAVWTLSKSHGIDFYQIFAPWGLVSSGALLVFGALVAVSMVRITPKLGGNKLGTAGASMVVVSAITGMLYYDLTISYVAITVPSGGASDLNALGVTLLTSYNVLVWITMTLLGAFLLLHHKSVPSSELWIVGGLIFIATGSYQFSIGLFVYIPIPLLVTGAVGIACFLAGKPAK